MLDAAKAALEAIDPSHLDAKSHATIIARFGKYVVVGKGLDQEIGKILNTTEDLRHVADYDRKPVSVEDARQTLEKLERLMLAVAAVLGEPPP